MGLWFHKYPGTNFHEQNIDWVIESIAALKEEYKNFKDVNQIKYAGAFDITKQYPIWSVVSDNNMGYIAIQNVPAGIPLTNTNYWELVADYSAVLAGIASRVTTCENKISALESEVSNLKFLKNKKVLWVGDSYGNGWNGNTSVTDPYYIVDSKIGWTGVNISRGGCRFGNSNTASQYKFLTLLQEYVAAHSDMDSFTDVIVIGGANDILQNPTSDISTAVQNVCDYIKAHFSNAVIHIGMVARLFNTGAGSTFGHFTAIRNQYIKCAADNGAEYIAGSELINHDYSLLASDGIHLTSYDEMGQKLAELITSGDFCHDKDVSANFTPITTNTADDIAPTTITFGSSTLRGNTVLIDCTDLEFNFSPERAITWRKTYKFCKISGDTSTRNIFAACTKAFKKNVSIVIDYLDANQDTQHTVQPATIYFYENYLYLSWEGLIEGSTSLTDCKSIHLRTGFQLQIDESYC